MPFLEIKEVVPSCGCSSAMVGQRTLNPSEKTSIVVTFDSLGTLGTVYKSVDVFSSDPTNPRVTLSFEASVVQEIMASAHAISINDVHRGGAASGTIRLQSGNDEPINVTKATFSNVPYLSCDAQRDENDVDIRITVDGSLLPKGKNRGVDLLLVETSNKKYPTCRFNIEWNIPAPITSSHSRILWVGTPSKEYRQTVTLKHADGKPFRVLKAKPSSSMIKVERMTKAKLAEHQIDIVFSKRAKPGMYSESVKLFLDEPEQKELEVYISAAFR